MRAPFATFIILAIVACKGGSNTRAPGDAAADAVVSAVGGECRLDLRCPAEQVCEYTPGLCGKGRNPGKCRPKPAACAEAYSPVCGCDGKTYDSACSARAAGVDLAVMGRCAETIAGWAPCGRQYCDVRTSYCEIFLSDVFELPTDYFCRPLPSSCLLRDGAPVTCDCFPPETRRGSFCGPLPTAAGAMSGLHVTHQGRRPPAE